MWGAESSKILQFGYLKGRCKCITKQRKIKITEEKKEKETPSETFPTLCVTHRIFTKRQTHTIWPQPFWLAMCLLCNHRVLYPEIFERAFPALGEELHPPLPHLSTGYMEPLVRHKDRNCHMTKQGSVWGVLYWSGWPHPSSWSDWVTTIYTKSLPKARPQGNMVNQVPGRQAPQLLSSLEMNARRCWHFPKCWGRALHVAKRNHWQVFWGHKGFAGLRRDGHKASFQGNEYGGLQGSCLVRQDIPVGGQKGSPIAWHLSCRKTPILFNVIWGKISNLSELPSPWWQNEKNALSSPQVLWRVHEVTG